MSLDAKLLIVVGSGGVGKTTLAAALGLRSAAGEQTPGKKTTGKKTTGKQTTGKKTLVMTFDPSRRLKDALGIGNAGGNEEVAVEGTGGKLFASLLDARETFDRLVDRYATDASERDRILSNSYYNHLAGHLGGILEYMAVERLYEVASSGRYERIILDTPPTAQAIDFLEAPARIVDFLDSGALKIALAPWFAPDGSLRPTSGLGFVGRGLEKFLDSIVGIRLLRDMSEFFRAFGPLFEGFSERARKTETLLAASGTQFLLVAGAGESRIPDTLFFARTLKEVGYRLGAVVVNRVHPDFADLLDAKSSGASPGVLPSSNVSLESDGAHLFRWLGERHRRGLDVLRSLLTDQPLAVLPLLGAEPADLRSLDAVGRLLEARLAAAMT